MENDLLNYTALASPPERKAEARLEDCHDFYLRAQSNLQASFVVFVFVQEAGHLLLECACLQQFSGEEGQAKKSLTGAGQR
jgi:hypothetical protein